MSPPLRERAPGVAYCAAPNPRLGDADLAALRAAAVAAPRRRARICAHRAPEDGLHEMIIALDRASYVRPHRHMGRSESFHAVAGEATVLLFDADGRLTEAVPLGPPGAGRAFFLRIGELAFHAVVVESEAFVFQETTSGPFDPRTTEAAPWAPADEDPAAGLAWLRRALTGRGLP